MNNKWIKLTVKFSNKCIQCDSYIMKGEKALWMEGLGIKHIDCPVINLEPVKDTSTMIIIDEEDKEMLGIK